MNELINYSEPAWIKIAFLVMIPLPFILILLLIDKVSKSINKIKYLYDALFFFIIYIGYIAHASNNGWFNTVMFPPKVLLLTTFPYAIFLFLYFEKTERFKSLFENTKIDELVKLHIFRIIGIFFILLALHDALPKGFAFIAGCGDIIAAVSSIYVVSVIRNKRPNAKKITTIWNIFGAVDIMFTAIAANVLTKISINTGSMGVDTLAKFPFCIIPAFAPPTILFLHFLIHKKIKEMA
jgi:hypothetical protein